MSTFLRKLGSYFRPGSNENKTDNFNLKTMHTINKISIFVFLAAILYLIGRHVF